MAVWCIHLTPSACLCQNPDHNDETTRLALATLHAVYGKAQIQQWMGEGKDLAQLPLPDVYQEYGGDQAQVEIWAPDRKAFLRELKPYAVEDAKQGAKQFWPLVRRICITSGAPEWEWLGPLTILDGPGYGGRQQA